MKFSSKVVVALKARVPILWWSGVSTILLSGSVRYSEGVRSSEFVRILGRTPSVRDPEGVENMAAEEFEVAFARSTVACVGGSRKCLIRVATDRALATRLKQKTCVMGVWV